MTDEFFFSLFLKIIGRLRLFFLLVIDILLYVYLLCCKDIADTARS